jgi:hypothetical protein
MHSYAFYVILRESSPCDKEPCTEVQNDIRLQELRSTE